MSLVLTHLSQLNTSTPGPAASPRVQEATHRKVMSTHCTVLYISKMDGRTEKSQGSPVVPEFPSKVILS